MIVVLTGSNSFTLRAELNKRVQAFLGVHGDMGLEKIDAEEAEFSRIQEALTSLPFLASKKLVVLRAPSAQKVFTEKITEVLEGIPESTDVIIIEPKLDKRGSYYKTLKAQTEFIECNELDGPGLSQWLVGQAKSEGGELKPSDATYLVDKVGVNQQLLSNELAKLLSYDPKITRETIDLLVEPTPQSTIFMLLDAALSGNAKRALTLYEDQRQQKIEPLAILAMLAWQLHILAIVKSAGERSPEAIAAEAKLNPYVVKKSQGVLRNVSLSTLKRWVHDLLELDVRLKSESIDADEALRLQLLKLAQ
jgi:DNA polymerase III subunit delta